MFKALVGGLLVSQARGLKVFGGVGVELIDGEMYPSKVDGTRMNGACVDAVSTGNFRVDGGQYTTASFTPLDANTDANDFVVSRTAAGFTVTFQPSTGGIKEGVLSIDDLEFGIGAGAYAPLVDFTVEGHDLAKLTSYDMGEVDGSSSVVFELVNYVSCSMPVGEITTTGTGFSAELSGTAVIVTFDSEGAGSYTGEVVVTYGGRPSTLEVHAQVAGFTEACTNYVLPSGEEWHDNGGDGYGCSNYYETDDKFCNNFGDRYPFMDFTAKQACCACGGGSKASDPQPAYCLDYTLPSGEVWEEADVPYYSCAKFTENPSFCSSDYYNFGINSMTACCACGGGYLEGEDPIALVPPTPAPGGLVPNEGCADATFDLEPWHDQSGPKYDCTYYGSKEGLCITEGNRYERLGLTAQTACCVCNIDDADWTGPQTVTAVCNDALLASGEPWHDMVAEKYHCNWYALANSRCEDYGDGDAKEGKTANDACCTCGGGVDESVQK